MQGENLRQGMRRDSSFTAPVLCAVKNRSEAEPQAARPFASLLSLSKHLQKGGAQKMKPEP